MKRKAHTSVLHKHWLVRILVSFLHSWLEYDLFLFITALALIGSICQCWYVVNIYTLFYSYIFQIRLMTLSIKNWMFSTPC